MLVSGCGCESLVEIGEDVVDVFDADGESNQLGRDACRALLVLGELGMSSRGRLDRKGFRVADVGEVFEKLEGIDEFRAGRSTALDAEDDHRATFPAEIFTVKIGLAIPWETGVADPVDGRVVLEVLGNGERIFAMTLHPKWQGLDALERLPRVVRREASPQISEWSGAHS